MGAAAVAGYIFMERGEKHQKQAAERKEAQKRDVPISAGRTSDSSSSAGRQMQVIAY